MKQTTTTYSGSGVDYDAMDPFKRMAQRAGLETSKNIDRLTFREVETSRGESVYLIEAANSYLAQVQEGLGTKNLVADAMYMLTGKTYYDQIAQDTVAMIVNDMITLGALPLSVAMHLAVGSSDWFDKTQRVEDLVAGWKLACNLARCVWGCGETPTLKEIVIPDTAELSGSAVGIVRMKNKLIKGNIQHGDAIIIIESGGICANGLTLARAIEGRLPDGYLTKLSDGRTYGETLLDPTPIYVPIIEECLDRDINIHYAVNITGHGWRKLMRSKLTCTYVIEQLPTQLPIFSFMQEHGPIDDREAYGTFNMNAGFALYVPEKDVAKTLDIIKNCDYPNGYTALYAGHIESGEKKVVIRPKNIVYGETTLQVR